MILLFIVDLVFGIMQENRINSKDIVIVKLAYVGIMIKEQENT